jgi:hypothetical protein
MESSQFSQGSDQTANEVRGTVKGGGGPVAKCEEVGGGQGPGWPAWLPAKEGRWANGLLIAVGGKDAGSQPAWSPSR